MDRPIDRSTRQYRIGGPLGSNMVADTGSAWYAFRDCEWSEWVGQAIALGILGAIWEG